MNKQKQPFKIEGKIKDFSGKQKLIEFMAGGCY